MENYQKKKEMQMAQEYFKSYLPPLHVRKMLSEFA